MLVEQVLEVLGLLHAGKRRVGGADRHGMLGGEHAPVIGALVEKPLHERAIDLAGMQLRQQALGVGRGDAHLHLGMAHQVVR